MADPTTFASSAVQGVRRFFEMMAGQDGDQVGADLFHDPFVSLDPGSVTVVTREQLRAALPARATMFASAGLGRAQLQEVRTTELDEKHVLARTVWTMTSVASTAEPVALESTYLLRREGDSWTAVVYLNHHDVRELLAR
jgi:ketosteroid isomerase-like protein